jgi:hypothetical protein
MGVLTTGEAFTTEKCALCGERHPLLTERAQSIFAGLGYTPDEIARIGAEQAEMASVPFGKDDGAGEDDDLLAEGAEPPHIKPSSTAEARRERKRRSRARQKGE